MSTRSFLAALVAMLPALSLAHVSAPDTRAGHLLDAWLDAFDSDDRVGVQAFIKSYAPSWDADDTANWQAETGGYELLEMYDNDETDVFFRVKARATAVEYVGWLKVGAAEPATIASIGTWRIPAGAAVDPVHLDATARQRLIDRIADAFESFYVYPEAGKTMAAALRANEKRGEYRAIHYGMALAGRLTKDLQEISHDKHAEVRFSFIKRPPMSPVDQPKADPRRLAAINCGFAKAEHLPPNIGYVKVDMFADPAICSNTAVAAMNFVADSDALILDLRENRGGGGISGFIASYLFEQRTRFIDSVDRAGVTQEGWTLPDVPGKKFIGKPVFVLTSKQTFSAAEAVSYGLKILKRATLVGETTAGGAHMITIKPIDDHFSVAVPFVRSISPITKTNWQGTGVEPDVHVSAEQAFDVARKLAAEEISKNRAGAAVDR